MVTEILGKHEAVARIIDEDLERPITKDDLVYSPAWSANLEIVISIVGLIDMDGDGQSDRERFHEMMASSNITIDNEVDGEGVRTGKGISVNTNLLVVADIPNLSDEANLPSEIKTVKAIARAHEKMVYEAREQSVRIITLKDFLQFLGYPRTQRL